jgi:hypothetical protein
MTERQRARRKRGSAFTPAALKILSSEAIDPDVGKPSLCPTHAQGALSYMAKKLVCPWR